MSDAPFELTVEERRQLAQEAVAWVLDQFDTARATPIYPQVTAEALDALLREPLPVEPAVGPLVLEQCRRDVAPHGRHNGHPRMFGYVSSPAAFIGVLGDLIASALNQNVTSWRSAPGATTLELVVLDWIKAMLGCAREASGLLLSGGSLANFTGLLVALRARTGLDVRDAGVRALPGEPRIYASALTHLSIGKAAEMLGLGRRAVREIPVGEDWTLDVAALDRAIDEDERAGCLPIAVVASAGDVNVGAIDPLDDVAAVCAARRVWCHVDGAYGGFAALAPSLKPRFAALARADSVALDPHKWLFVPIDAGCLLVRDPGALHAAFGHETADYVTVLDSSSHVAFWDRGPELTRRFRALKIWLVLKRHGVRALGEAIERNVALARQLGALVDEAPDFERLAPVTTSIVCFRHVPAALRAATGSPGAVERQSAEARVNALNRDITAEVQRGGYETYFSNTVLGGRFALRACITNYRTEPSDLPVLLDEIRRAAAFVGSS